MSAMHPGFAIISILSWLALPVLIVTAQVSYPLVITVVNLDGTPVRGVLIEGFDDTGMRVVSGRTDAEGRYAAQLTQERVALKLSWIAPTGTVFALGTVNDLATMRLWVNLTIGDPEVAFVATDRAIMLAPEMLAPDLGEPLLPGGLMVPRDTDHAVQGTTPIVTPLPFPTTVAGAGSSAAPASQGTASFWPWMIAILIFVVVVLGIAWVVLQRKGSAS